MKTAISQFLPDHPGDLIRLAVLDLVAAASTKGYRINMDVWHSGLPRRRKVCSVCMAGAVMAKSLRVDIGTECAPDEPEFDRDTAQKLQAINEFRSGSIVWGYGALSRERPSSLP